MEEKLKRLMRQEGINSTRLAEMLGIQASGISHIMNGRNKPSYDFLIKLLQRFPQINPDWLLLDKGPMYRDEIKKSGTQAATTAATATGMSATTATGMTTGRTAQATGIGTVIGTPAINPGMNLFADPGRPYEASRHGGSMTYDDEDIIPTDSPVGSYKMPSGATDPVPVSSRGFAPSSAIERIVVFYKDKTFSEYQPA
jgi:transcriptional regulator with XRE-family HTH domain